MAGSVDGDGDSEDGMAIFQEPDDYYPPEKQPTTATYQMINGTDLTLRLVGHNPLWVGARPTLFACLLLFLPKAAFSLSPVASF